MTDTTNQIELALLTRVIYDRNFQALEKAQITEEFFFTPLAKEVYRFMRFTYHSPATAGEVPSLELIQMHFPNSFYPHPSNDTVPVLAAELRKQKVYIELQLLSQNVSELAERDPMAAMAVLKAETSKIASLSQVGQDMSLSNAYNQLLSNYEMVQAGHGLLGIPFPWEPLNAATQGMQEGQLIILYARPKQMKTWVGLHMATHAYRNCRRKVLIYSLELTPDQVIRRMACLFCGVDYDKFIRGTLQPHMKELVFLKLQELKDDETSASQYTGTQPYIKVITNEGGGGGVSWLAAKVREDKPDLVVVDGMYLMPDDRTKSLAIDWKNVAHVSQDLKRMARNEKIPVIGITQANRGSEKSKDQELSGLAYADAIGQDADAVFHLKKKEYISETTKRKVTEVIMTATAMRDGIFEGMVINGEPANDFSFKRPLAATDFEDEEKPKKAAQFQRPAEDPTLPSRGRFER